MKSIFASLIFLFVMCSSSLAGDILQDSRFLNAEEVQQAEKNIQKCVKLHQKHLNQTQETAEIICAHKNPNCMSNKIIIMKNSFELAGIICSSEKSQCLDIQINGYNKTLEYAQQECGV